MLVSCCGTSRSICLTQDSAALTEQQIVDGILLNPSSPITRSEATELIAQLIDAMEEKNLEVTVVARYKPASLPKPGPVLVSNVH